MLRILLSDSLLPFYSHVPRQSFPHFPRENCTNHLLASKNWLDIIQLWRVVISCTTQHSWFTILLVLLPLLWLCLICPSPFPEQQICPSSLFRHSYTIHPVSIVRGLVKVIFFFPYQGESLLRKDSQTKITGIFCLLFHPRLKSKL